MKISSASPSSTVPISSDDSSSVDGGQSLVDDVMQILQQLAQQAQQQGANPDGMLQQLTDGVDKLQTASTDGSLTPEVKAQADQLLQALTDAAQSQAQKNTGYSKQDTYQPTDAAQGTQGAHRKHHHHHHAKPVQPADPDSNAVAPDPTQS